jgi:hypothetical protein
MDVFIAEQTSDKENQETSTVKVSAGMPEYQKKVFLPGR